MPVFVPIDYESEQFNFEVVVLGDDMYPPDTLLLYSKPETKNTVNQGLTIKNEIDLKSWNNLEFKDFLNKISNREPGFFECFVHDDPVKKIKIQYNEKSNILTIPLREGKYYIMDADLIVDDQIVTDLFELYRLIEKAYTDTK